MSATNGSRGWLSVAADVAAIISSLMLVLFGTVMLTSVLARSSQIRAGTADSPAVAPAQSRPRQPPVTPVAGLKTRTNATTQRPPRAKVAIVEFTDFQCPFCAGYARDVYPLLKTEFVDSSRVAYLARSFPVESIHPLAFRASEAAECAGEQGSFWEMYSQLFANQDRLTESDLQQHAEQVGLHMTKFRACLKAGRSSVVREDHAEGTRLGIRATPTFLIGLLQSDGTIIPRKRLLGALPYDMFKAAIEQVLADAETGGP